MRVGDDEYGYDGHPFTPAIDAGRRHIWRPTWGPERRGESVEQKMDQSRGRRDDDDESRIRQTIRDGHPIALRLDVEAGVTPIARRGIERGRRSITFNPSSLEGSSYGSPAFGPHFDKKWTEQPYDDLEEQKQLIREKRNAFVAKQCSFDGDRERFKREKGVLDAERRALEKQRQNTGER